MNTNIEPFQTIDANPGGTLQRFNRYIERMKLFFDLVFRKPDGTAYTPTDKEKKSMTVFRGGDDMTNLFEHVGKVQDGDTFEEAILKITNERNEPTRLYNATHFLHNTHKEERHLKNGLWKQPMQQN